MIQPSDLFKTEHHRAHTIYLSLYVCVCVSVCVRVYVCVSVCVCPCVLASDDHFTLIGQDPVPFHSRPLYSLAANPRRYIDDVYDTGCWVMSVIYRYHVWPVGISLTSITITSSDPPPTLSTHLLYLPWPNHDHKLLLGLDLRAPTAPQTRFQTRSGPTTFPHFLLPYYVIMVIVIDLRYHFVFYVTSCYE